MKLCAGHYLLITFFIATQCLLIFLRYTLHGVDYYRLRRVHNLVNMEFVMVLGSMFIWKRVTDALSHLDPDKITPARFRWRTICFQDVARATLFILLALSQLSFLFYFFLLGEEPHILAQFSLVGLAAYLHALIFLAIAELTYWVAKALYKLDYFKSQCRYVINGRHLYTYLSLFCAALFILGGLYVTFSDPVYTRVTVPIRNLHNGDVKVALLSDLHIGPTVGQKRMSRIAELTNDLNPDIVAISGDLADGFVRDFEGAASPLCKLKPKHGVYFATEFQGNHEYMHGNVEEWFAYLEGCNITVLHNSQKRIVLPNGDKICVAGADDLYAAKAHFPGHGMDAKKAIVGCQPGDAVIMLAHQPNAARVMLDDSIVSKRVDLILSGHTHGGQMYLFVPVIYLVNAFARGLYYNEPTGVYVYVSAGVNYFGPPIKMFGACEIIDITLKPVI